jgi:hypothetical protein
MDNQPPSTHPQRWAQVPPGEAWKHPGLPTYWVRVLERHPEPLGLAGTGTDSRAGAGWIPQGRCCPYLSTGWSSGRTCRERERW